ncbi:MAG: hypothetical protein MI723_16835, partial [Caulobacterales bacterium]|nr:hypothetical protein [Caulobacterales bacterium]
VGPLADLSEERPERVIADSLLDFSLVQGQDGWTYGNAVANEDGSIGELVQGELGSDAWKDFWFTRGKPWSLVTRTQLQATSGRGGINRTTKQWTADRDGPLKLFGHFWGQRKGDGADVGVYHNGEPLWTDFVNPGDPLEQKTFELIVEVAEGDGVQFATGPGPAGEYSFDSIPARMRIALPEATVYRDEACIGGAGEGL